MYGVNMDRPGAQAYYNSVIDQLASWGIDFIKYDDILHKPREIEAPGEVVRYVGMWVCGVGWVTTTATTTDYEDRFFESSAVVVAVVVDRKREKTV